MRVLIIEDDVPVAQSLKLLLSHHNYGVDLALNGAQAIDLLEAFEYDLLILDFLLPDTDGVHLCRQLRDQKHLMPILLLTGQNSVEQKALALESGADDYVVKPFDSRELLARVQALLRRGMLRSTPHLTWGDLRLDPSGQQVSYGGQGVNLTPKEYALLELMLRRSDRTFSAKLLLDRVWAAEEYPGEETVRTHIKGLRQKLRKAGAPGDFIETIHRVGYRLNPACNGQKTALPEAIPEAISVVAVAPAASQPELRQALEADPSFRLTLLEGYDRVLPELAHQSPGLLLLSYDLDPTASLALCRRLHQLTLWQHLPIMFLIAQKTPRVIRQVFEAGACDVMAQPVVGPELRTRLGQLAQAHRLSQPSFQPR